MSLPSPRFSKYHGLLEIERHRLRHPDWRFVTEGAQVPGVPWTDACHGWTVRSCPRVGYQFQLPSRHKLKYVEIEEAVETFRRLLPESVFVIYPSWQYACSGGVHITARELVIEAVKGDIAPLLKGRKTPDSIYRFSRMNGGLSMIEVAGDESLIRPGQREFIVRSCRHITPERFIVLEWSLTTDMGFYFHDWIEYA